MEEYQQCGFDYCFWRDHPGGESVPVMVGREQRTKMMIAHVGTIQWSGVDQLLGQLMRYLVKMSAHVNVTLKSGQEKAILDVLNVVCKQEI